MVELLDSEAATARLAGRLHDRLEALGVYRRERPRLQPPVPELGTFVPSDAAAYLSRLHPSGARYEVLEAVPLRPSMPHDDDPARRMSR
jgi:hypothetical protein